MVYLGECSVVCVKSCEQFSFFSKSLLYMLEKDASCRFWQMWFIVYIFYISEKLTDLLDFFFKHILHDFRKHQKSSDIFV